MSTQEVAILDAEDVVIVRDIGLCTIKETLAEGSSSRTILYIAVPFLAPDMPIRVPADALVRKAIALDAAREVVERIPYLRTLQAANDKAYAELLQASFDTYDPIEWVRIVKSTYIRKKHGKARSAELPLAEKARTYLHSELAMALSIPYGEVEAHIVRSISEDL